MGSQDDGRAALVLFLGALGDLVLALPAVEAVRARESRGARVHAADFALEGVLRAGLGDLPAGGAVPRLDPTAEDLDAARALLARAGVHGPFAVVHPGAGSRAKRAPCALLARA